MEEHPSPVDGRVYCADGGNGGPHVLQVPDLHSAVVTLPETTRSPTVNTAEVTVLPRGHRVRTSSTSPCPHCTADTNPATPGPVGRAERRGCGHREWSTQLTGAPANPCQLRGRTDLSKAASPHPGSGARRGLPDKMGQIVRTHTRSLIHPN